MIARRRFSRGGALTTGCEKLVNPGATRLIRRDGPREFGRAVLEFPGGRAARSGAACPTFPFSFTMRAESNVHSPAQ